MAENLWGYFDPQTNEYKSYVDEYAEVDAVQGVNGCDYLLGPFANYFGNYIKYLTAKGYENGKTLFVFNYDWRQSISSPSIQDRLDKLLDSVFEISKQYPAVVAHSLGGLVAENYLRLHPETEKVSRLITICTPFDGASAISPQSVLHGYNFKLPLSQAAFKGWISGCASGIFMSPKPRGTGYIYNIYLKRSPKFKAETPLQTASQDSKLLKPEISDPTSVREGWDLANQVKLYPGVYKDQTPDVMFCVAQRMLLGRVGSLADFQVAQKCCKPGAILINNQKSVFQASFLKHFERKLVKKEATEGEFEAFQTWGFPWARRDRTVEDSKFVHKGAFTEEFFKACPVSVVKGEKRNSRKEDKNVEIVTEHEEEAEDDKAGCVVGKEDLHAFYEAKIIQSERSSPGPWNEKVQPRAAQELMKIMHPEGTMEGMVFDHPIELYRHTFEERTKALKVHRNFRFGSVCCRGIQTAVHMVFDHAVDDYSDILEQEPDYLYTTDGDGTVLTVNQLADEFKGDTVIERAVLENVTHGGSVGDERVWKKIDELLK